MGACGGESKPPQTPAAAPTAALTSETETKLRAALNDGAARSPEERARDKYRHPVETLGFFGLNDSMHVVELWPGGGWFTTVLAPVVRDRGKLTITSFDPAGPADAYPTKSAKRLRERLDKHPELFGKVEVRTVRPPADIQLGPDGSADLVVTFRNFHNWMDGGYEDKVLAAAFRVLKPGGILGIEEHRAAAGTPVEVSKKTGYVDEAYVVQRAEAAGFRLEGRSEVNANSADTKDYAEGVWALPPTLALKDKDRAKYEKIGESDRMTLKFRKPEH
jgi:predicted methyltransferase